AGLPPGLGPFEQVADGVEIVGGAVTAARAGPGGALVRRHGRDEAIARSIMRILLAIPGGCLARRQSAGAVVGKPVGAEYRVGPLQQIAGAVVTIGLAEKRLASCLNGLRID